MSQKEAEHPLTLRATRPKYIQKYGGKKNSLEKGRNKLYGTIRIAEYISFALSTLVRFCLRLAHWYDACV